MVNKAVLALRSVRLPARSTLSQSCWRASAISMLTIAVDAMGGDYSSRLSFKFSIDQTYLPAVIAAVERHFLNDAPSAG